MLGGQINTAPHRFIEKPLLHIARDAPASPPPVPGVSPAMDARDVPAGHGGDITRAPAQGDDRFSRFHAAHIAMIATLAQDKMLRSSQFRTNAIYAR